MPNDLLTAKRNPSTIDRWPCSQVGFSASLLSSSCSDPCSHRYSCPCSRPRKGGSSPKSPTLSFHTQWPPSSSSDAVRWRCSSSGGCCPCLLYTSPSPRD